MKRGDYRRLEGAGKRVAVVPENSLSSLREADIDLFLDVVRLTPKKTIERSAKPPVWYLV